MSSIDFNALNNEIMEIEKDFEILDPENSIEAQMIESRLLHLQNIIINMDQFIKQNDRPYMDVVTGD